MPSNVPKVDEETPGHLTVFIKNPADGSVGTCTVDQYRDLYQHQDWSLTDQAEHVEHTRALDEERRFIAVNRPELLEAINGETAAKRATSRSATTTKEG